MVNSQKMKERMKCLGITQATLAERVGIEPSTMNQKINNVRPMYLHEVETVAEVLAIGQDLFFSYFLWSEENIAEMRRAQREYLMQRIKELPEQQLDAVERLIERLLRN